MGNQPAFTSVIALDLRRFHSIQNRHRKQITLSAFWWWSRTGNLINRRSQTRWKGNRGLCRGGLNIGNGDGTLLVINEENKLNGMEGNRRIDGDVVCGPFFVAL